MPIKEILQAIVFVHRVPDNKDIEKVINCIPDARMKDLEAGLAERRDNGNLDLVQIGRMRKQVHPLDAPPQDQVDDFLTELDGCTLSPEFTGFDNVKEIG